MKAGITSVISLAAILVSCRPHQGTELTLAAGKDPAGYHRVLLGEFERRNPGIKVKLLEMPESSSAQHDAYVTYLAGRDRSIDVYSIDIIWPAEFASAGWLLPLDGLLDSVELADFLPGPLAGCRYGDSLYAVPWFTDAGLLYYRADILGKHGMKPPDTWEELIKQASALSKSEKIPGFVWQGQQYEGLVCNFLEVLWSCGGDVFGPDGRPAMDSPQALKAAGIMLEMLRTNASPRGVLTYKEEEARQLFTGGNAVFMRNWPYAWTIAQDSTQGSAVAGRTGFLPLPSLDGKSSAACLGGWNLAVSRHSQHPEAAAELVRFLASPKAQKGFALHGGRLPTRSSAYADPEVLEANPHFAQLHRAFAGARPRPVRPDYPKASDIIQLGLHRILAGQATAAQGLAEIQRDLMGL